MTPTITPSTTPPIEQVTIGTQIWMKKNLAVTTFRNGDAIPRNISMNVTTAAYANPIETSDESNVSNYGRHYNYYAVSDARGLCPTGWHMPTRTEVETLITFLGGASVAGGKLRENNTTYWNTNNGDNSSNFSARGAGASKQATDWLLKTRFVFWTQTYPDPDVSLGASSYVIFDNTNPLQISPATYSGNRTDGYSVRCIKD